MGEEIESFEDIATYRVWDNDRHEHTREHEIVNNTRHLGDEGGRRGGGRRGRGSGLNEKEGILIELHQRE